MKLLISNKSKIEFKNFLRKNKISYLETLDNPILDKRIADHPDLSVFVLDRENIVVDRNVYPYYKENLPDINVIRGDSVGRAYPEDAIYNIVRFKNYFIHNKYSEKTIVSYMKKNNFRFLDVKQGYTRCSSIVLKDSIITSDYGLYKSLKDKVNIILIEQEKIELDGFDQGFMGGTCGLIDENKLIFNGQIKYLKSYDIIKEQCEKENIELLYPTCKLLDTGSLLSLG